MQNFCVQDCREAHQSYINQPLSQTCQCIKYQPQVHQFLGCGQGCQSCNLYTGCELCPGEIQNKGWVTALNQFSNTLEPSNFGICQACQNDKCDQCSSIDTSHCESCSFPVNQTSNPDYPVSCYYQEQICLDAFGQYDCQNCIYGYSSFSHNGESRCYKCFNENQDLIYPEAVRCSFVYNESSSSVEYQKTTGCLDSFVDLLTGSCTTNCGEGRFGETNFTLRGMIETSTCQNCDQNCYECAGYGSNMCLSCPKGYYLEKSDITKQFGTCQIKSGTQNLTIYVLPQTLYNPQNQPLFMDGTQDYPFFSINDALLRAEDFGAPFLESTVMIILLNHNNLPHAMLRKQSMPAYQTQRSDKYSQSTKIIIDTEDQSQVMVLYKQRDTFKFKIGPSLTMKNLIFDAIDSTDQCLMPFGGSFIQFDINGNSMIVQPQTLKLENVTFKNFIYEFNSFIELNDYGGYVFMKNVKFENINSCGSIIRNKKPLTMNKTYDNAQFEISQLYNLRSNNVQFEINQKHEQQLGSFNPFSGICSDDKTLNLPPCFQLVIDNMTVTRMESMKDPSSDVIAVDPNYGMQFTGSVLDLNNFKGPIILKNSYFNNNYATYRDSRLGLKLFQNELPISDNYPSLGSVGPSGISGGSIKIECIDDTTETQINSLTNYQQITDPAIKESRFNFNYTQLPPQLIQESEIYDSISFDYLLTSFIGNTLKNSTSSAQRGLINMINVPRLNMSDNLFELIMDHYSIDPLLSPQGEFIVSATLLDSSSYYILMQTYNNLYTDFNNSNLASSVINVKGAQQIVLNNVQLSNNTLLTTTYMLTRAELLYSSDFYGSLQVKNLQVNFHSGIYNLLSNAVPDFNEQAHQPRFLFSIMPLIRIDSQSKYLLMNSVSGVFSNVIRTLNPNSFFQPQFAFNNMISLTGIDIYFSLENQSIIDYITFQSVGSVVQIAGENNEIKINNSTISLIELNKGSVLNLNSVKSQISIVNQCLIKDLSSEDQNGTFLALDSVSGDIQIEELTLINLQGGNGGFIYIRQSFQVSFYGLKQQQLNINMLDSNLLINNLNNKNGQLIYSEASNINLTLVNNSIQYAFSGGILFSENSIISISQNQYESIYSQFGTISYLKQNSSITFTNILVNNLNTQNFGGLVYADDSEINDTPYLSQNITLKGDIILHNISVNGAGGIIYIDGQDISLDTQGANIIAKNLQSRNSSAFMYVRTAQNITFNNLQIDGVVCRNGGCVLEATASQFINITNSLINCVNDSYNQDPLYLYTDQNLESAQSGHQGEFRGSALFLQNSEIFSAFNQFTNCIIAFQGGAIQIKDSNLTDINSTYINNSAFKGGAIFAFDSNVTLHNATFDTHFAVFGGSIFILESSLLTFYNLIVNVSFSYKHGAFLCLEMVEIVDLPEYISQNYSVVQFMGDTQIKYILANQKGGVLYSHNPNSHVYLNGTGSISNSVSEHQRGAGFHFENGRKLVVLNFTFNKIFSLYNNAEASAIFVEVSQNYYDENNNYIEVIFELYLENNTFDNEGLSSFYTKDLLPDILADHLYEKSFPNNAGQLFKIDNSEVTSIRNIYQNVKSSEKQVTSQRMNAIFGLTNSKFYEDGSIYRNNQCLYKGCSIACYLCNNVTITNAIFDNNGAVDPDGGQGGVFYFETTYQDIILNNLTILNSYNKYGNGAVLSMTWTENQVEEQKLLYMRNVSVNNASSGAQGGFAYIQSKSTRIVIQDSYFENVISSEGGVFYILDSINVEIANVISNKSSKSFNGQFLTYINKNNDDSAQTNITLNNLTIDCQQNLEYYQQYEFGMEYFGDSSLISVFKSNYTSSQNTTFKNCNSVNYAYWTFFSSQYFEDANSIYQNLNSSQFGVYEFNQVDTAKLSNNTYRSINCYTGCISKLVQFGIYEADNLTASQITAYSGSLIHSTYSSSVIIISRMLQIAVDTYAIITVKNSNFTNIQAIESAAGFYLLNPYIKEFNLTNSYFENITANQGSVFFLETINGTVNIGTENDKNILKNISAKIQGSLIYSVSSYFSLILQNSLIQCQETYQPNITNLSQQLALSQGIIYIDSANKVTSSNNIIQNCQQNMKTGVFSLANTKFSDKNSVYMHNYAYQGGIYYFNNIQYDIEDCTYNENYGSYGTVFYLINNISNTLKNLSITNNASRYFGGVFYLVKSSINQIPQNLTLNKESFRLLSNSSASKGGVFYIANTEAEVYLDSIIIQNSTAVESGGVIFIADAKLVKFYNTTILKSKSVQGGILYSQSFDVQIQLEESLFYCLKDQDDFSQTWSQFYVESANLISSLQNQFYDCESNVNSGFFLLRSTYFIDDSSIFG
eukprot:403350695